jgi:hypothetical protein
MTEETTTPDTTTPPAADTAGVCEPAQKGETTVGRFLIGTAWQLAAMAATAVQTVTAVEMSNRQFEIAQRYYQISRSWKDWYNEGFAPLEDMELDEVMTEALAVPHYDVAEGRAAGRAKGMLAKAMRDGLRCTSQYDTGLRRYLLRRGAEGYGAALGNALALGYRNERSRVEALKALRWKHKLVAALRGRNIMSQSASFGLLAANIYGSLAQQAGKIAGEYMTFLGYARDRFETIFPGKEPVRGTRSPATDRNDPAYIRERDATVESLRLKLWLDDWRDRSKDWRQWNSF